MRLMRPTSVPRRTRCVRAGAAALSGALTLAAGAADNQVGSANRDSAIATASKEQGRMLMTVGARRFTVTPGRESGHPDAPPPMSTLPRDVTHAGGHGSEPPPAGANRCSPTWAQPSADGRRVFVACNGSSDIAEIDQSSR